MHPDEVCDVLKNDLKANESAYKVAHPRVTEFPPAYRSAKSVILSAIKAGICLKDENGKLKGKTALEQEIKEGKEVKSELQKFQSSIDTAAKIFAKIDNLGDIRQAKALTAVLVDMILKAERASMAVVDEQKAA